MGKNKFDCIHMWNDRNIVVDILSMLYGLGSWIAMTGLWVELPLLVQRLPEGWSLASTLTLTLQVANIGPIVYGLLNQWFPTIVTEISGTHAQLLIGSVSTLLLIFTWSSTVYIAANEISLSLYILAFGLSIVDCTSSVVFLPYMARFRSIYLVPYLIGEGLSGFIPSLVAFAQGIGEEECIAINVTANDSGRETIFVSSVGEPLFEPEWFFAILLFMVMLSWMAFVLLDKLKFCRREMISNKNTQNDEQIRPENENDEQIRPENENDEQIRPENEYEMHKFVIEEVCSKPNGASSSNLLFYYMLGIQGWASLATFGIFPPIQTFSCLPYGYKPLHYAVVFGGAAYPVACLVALFYAPRTTKSISILTFIASVLSFYIMYTAVVSPHPPLTGLIAGDIIIVFSWVSFTGLFSYIKTLATVVLSEHWEHRGLFWCGVVTQAGAASGAFLMFLLINVFELFHDNKEC